MTRRRRMVLGFVDQGLSSASNILMMFAVARTSSVVEFGSVAVVLMFLTTALAISRGSFGTPLLLSSSKSSAARTRELAGAQTGAIAVGVVVALAMLAAGAIEAALVPAAVLAIASPVVLAQDAQRFAALAREDQFGAVVWDGIWAGGALALLVVTWADPHLLSGVKILACWGLLAAVSLTGLGLRSRTWPLWSGWGTWWGESRGHRIRFGVEGAVGTLSSLVVVSGAAALIGATAAAALRGASMIMGPLSILMSAIPLAIVPEAARAAHSTTRTWMLLQRVALGMSFLALAVGSLGFVLPEVWGTLLLGESWRVVAPLLPITGLEYASLAWVSVMYSALRSSGRSRDLLRARVLHAAVSLVSAICAAFWFSTAVGVAWGLAIAAALSAVLVRPILGIAHTRHPRM